MEISHLTNEPIKSDSCVSHLGPYRVLHLTKIIDPATESRRCLLFRRMANVQEVEDYHTDIDIASHLGTHVEAPYHHANFTKDVVDIPFSQYAGRGVLFKLDTCRPRALITREDLDTADRGRLKPGDVVLLDSPYHFGTFCESAG